MNNIEIVIDQDDRTDFDQVRRKADNAGQGIVSSFKTAGATAAGFLVAELTTRLAGWAAGGVAWLWDSAGLYSDTLEAMNKVDAVFDNSASAIRSFAQNAAQNIGLSERAALDAAGTFGNMFDQLGYGSDQASAMSQQMIILASDFASFHNADITDVLDAQSAAFRGEYDSIQRFLPLMNAANVEAKAMEQTGKANASQLTQQEKALAAYTLMVEGAGEAQGDFAATAEGAANQQRILEAETENLRAEIGEKMLPIQLAWTQAKLAMVAAISDKVLPALSELWSWASQYLIPMWETAKDAVSEFVEGFKGAGDGIASSGFTEKMEALGTKAREIITIFVEEWWPKILGAIQAVVEFIQGIDWAQLWADVQPILQAVQDHFQDLWEKVDEIIGFVVDVIDAIDWAQLWEDVEPILTQVADTFSDLYDAVQATLEDLEARIDLAISTMEEFWAAHGETITAMIQNTWNLLVALIQGALDIIQGAIRLWQSVMEGDWSTFWSAIQQIFSGALQILWALVVAGFNNILITVTAIDNQLKAGVDNAWATIKNTVSNYVNSVVSTVRGFRSSVASAVSGMWNGILSGLTSVVDGVSSQINRLIGLYNSIPGVPDVPTIGSSKRYGGQLTRRAGGGLTEGFARVAENAAEMMTFPGGGQVLALPPGTMVSSGSATARDLAVAGGGGGATVNLTINVQGNMRADSDIEGIVARALNRGGFGVRGVNRL